MDKNKIKSHLQSFLAEAEKQPVGKTETEKVQKQEKGVNNDYYKEVSKKMGDYDRESTNGGDSIKSGDLEKTDSGDMDVNPNGMDQIQYDNDPSAKFKERAIEALEGSSKMGNKTYEGKWDPATGAGNGNTEEVWGASGGKHAGKEIVKSAKAVAKKDAKSQEDAVGYVPSKTKTKLATENTIKEGISDHNVKVLTNWIEKDGSESTAVKLLNRYSESGMLSDMPDSLEYGTAINKLSSLLNKGNFELALKSAKSMASKLDKKAKRDFMGENKQLNNEIIKESSKMKRLKFKQPFNGIGKALTLIPEGYRVDNKVFEMTDGNENYTIRWEGTLTEGQAVVLKASDKQMMNEDIQHMKHLMGFKSESTLGTPTAKERLSENTTFRDIMTLTNRILEGKEEGDKKPIRESAFAGMGFTSESNIEEVAPAVSESDEEMEAEVTESKGETPNDGGESSKIGSSADGIVRSAGHDKHIMEEDDMLEGFDSPKVYSENEISAGTDLGTDIGKTSAGDPRGAGHDQHIMEDEEESMLDEGWRDFLGMEKGDAIQQKEEEFNAILDKAEAKGMKVQREFLTNKARENKFRGKLVPVKGTLIYQAGASGLGKMSSGAGQGTVGA